LCCSPDRASGFSDFAARDLEGQQGVGALLIFGVDQEVSGLCPLEETDVLFQLKENLG